MVELSELLIEVDGWTRFSDDFEHAGGTEPRGRELRSHLYASVLAQACNLGPTRMARISDLTYQKLAWCTNWYVRDETLKAATTRLVNFQYRQPLSRFWGTGTLSSSDGQRFPVSGKVRMATALPRYFGYGKGVTFYTWTADQFSQYGTKVIPATVRDATYVLDEILDNETELPILEHTTDTAGYTEIVFALFDLLGLQFSPRIRDLGDQRLFRMDRQKRHPHLGPLLKGRINRDRILRHWDDLLRVAGSLKRGWVTASLLIGKLQSYPRKNRPDPGPAGVRPPGQDDLHPPLPGERGAPAADPRPAQQGRGPARPAGVPALRQQGHAPEEAGGGAEEPGGLPEPGDQRGGDLEHGLHGGGDRPAPGRGQDGERGGHRPALAGPLRAHQPVRQVPLRGRGGVEPLPLASAPPAY